MKVTIHCEGTPSEIAEQLTEAAKVYAGEHEEMSKISIEEIKKGRGRPKKEEPEAVDPDDETEEETTEEETTEETSEEEETFEEAEEVEEDKISEDDLKKLKAALNAHQKKHGKEKAIKILHKYAKRSDAVKPADLSKLMKALKV
jgi:hypothetical protein